MALIDTRAPLVTLALHAQPSAQPEPIIILDAIPTRVHPQEGYTVEDAILACLGDAHSPRVTHWIPTLITPWLEGKSHPVASLGPGAFTISTTEDAGQVPPDAVPVHLDAHTLRIGDTAFDRSGFSASIYSQHAEALHSVLHRHTERAPHGFALAMGALVYHLDHKGQANPLCTLGPIMALVVWMSSLYGPHAGRQARCKGLDMADTLITTLAMGWILRGNTVVAATHCVATDAFYAHIAPHQSSPYYAAGRAAAEALWGLTFAPDVLAGITSPKQAGLNGHQTLALRVASQRLEQTLLAHLPAEILKPMAARRKAQLGG